MDGSSRPFVPWPPASLPCASARARRISETSLPSRRTVARHRRRRAPLLMSSDGGAGERPLPRLTPARAGDILRAHLRIGRLEPAHQARRAHSTQRQARPIDPRSITSARAMSSMMARVASPSRRCRDFSLAFIPSAPKQPELSARNGIPSAECRPPSVRIFASNRARQHNGSAQKKANSGHIARL